MMRTKIADLVGLIARHVREDGVEATPVAGLTLHRASAPSELHQVLCEPALCVIAQGRKRVALGDEAYDYDPAHFLLVSVDLPIVGQILEATPDRPYLAIKLSLDLGQAAEMLMDARLPGEARGGPPSRGMAVSLIAPGLLDAVVRLVALLETPEDIGVLAPLISREIIYRILTSEQGARLRQMATDGGLARRVAMAIDRLRREFDRPLRIEDAARAVHMSPSAFHHAFKAVTAMSPLQYQKRLRLQEARRLMAAEGLDAASAAYRVGYESPSQFSREYRRFFGDPPRRDLARLRTAAPPVEA